MRQNRWTSPVVISAILLGGTAAVKAIQLIPNPQWTDYTLVLLGYLYLVFVAYNDPTNKRGI